MPIAHTDWIDIAYVEHGDPAGQPVLLLHGFPDSCHTWDGVVSELRSEKLRLIVPDLRGYGQTKILQADAGGGMEGAIGQDAVDPDRRATAGQDGRRRPGLGRPGGVRGGGPVPRPGEIHRGDGDPVRGPSRGRTPLPPAQVQAYWYQWYFNTETGAAGFKNDVVGFCRHLWRAWSPAWRFTEAEFEQAAQAWHRPEFADLVLHAYRVRYGNAPKTPRYARQQAAFDARPKITVPCWSAGGLADHCTVPGRAAGQERWFTGGYQRHDLPGVGHFVQREAPAFVADLVRQAAAVR